MPLRAQQELVDAAQKAIEAWLFSRRRQSSRLRSLASYLDRLSDFTSIASQTTPEAMLEAILQRLTKSTSRWDRNMSDIALRMSRQPGKSVPLMNVSSYRNAYMARASVLKADRNALNEISAWLPAHVITHGMRILSTPGNHYGYE